MKLEIYFDYLCEFCELGHRYWKELLPKYPQISPVWCPCEAHPRELEPRYGMYSDLAIQGMFFVQECGGDVEAYNDLLFDAAWRQGKHLEDIGRLAAHAGQCGVNAASFSQALYAQTYKPALQQANRRAWETLGFSAVPSYVLENGRRLDAVLGTGVSRERLEAFLQSAI